MGPFLGLILLLGPSVLAFFGKTAQGHRDHYGRHDQQRFYHHHHGRHEGHEGHHQAEQLACPVGWKEKPFLCFEYSHKEYNLADAFSYCLSQQNPGDGHWNGNYFGLISVGQLRHFKTRFPYAMEVNRPEHDFEHGRLFRVNAMKTGSGWYEIFTGKEVQFHHYPGFNPKAGRPGDSLIWDSKYDKLFTAGPHETFHSLCSTRRNDICKECPDAQWENECNNAGDCKDGVCYCDSGFEGYKCQVEPLEDAKLDLLVYAGSPANPSYKYNLETNNTCPISNFPANIENPVSGSAFGHPISCGGNTIGSSAVDQCWIYHHQSWMPEVGMLTPRTEAAATVINDGTHYLIYWVTFGEDESGNYLSTTEYLPWYGESWKPGPSLAESYARKGHCTVQINKCEAAVLGGVSNETDPDYRDDILIFNFEDAKWKLGPQLRVDRANLACATIKDSITDHPIVISACGTGANGIESGVEKWDLVTWDTEILPYDCPSNVDYFDSAWAISDHEIIFTTGSGSDAENGIWSFTLDHGFRQIDSWPQGKMGAGSALISRDYVDCSL